MSLAADEVLSSPVPRSTALSTSASLPRLRVYLACTLLALAANFLIGKEMAWDMLNYHLYAGFSALHDRFGQDYFAAGAQSYFNPYAYVPFYLLVSAGLPGLAAASVLAVLHSVILWLSFELGALLAPVDASPRARVTLGLCSAAFAFLNPIVFQQIGSSFADITTATLALGGWLALARACVTPQARRVVLGGVLLGVACALKPTNVVHAVAALALAAMIPGSAAAKARGAARYGAALVISFVIVCAPWSYQLQAKFGNPLFPLLNGVFRSPEFSVEAMRQFRFIPDDLWAAIWRPFAMVSPGAMVHEELSAPDLRYAALIVLLAVLGISWLWRRGGPAPRPAPAPREHPDPGVRLLAALCLGLLIDWSLWLYGSGNSRYFLPPACVAGCLVMALIFRLKAPVRIRGYLLAALLGAQTLQVWEGSDYRWHDVPWEGPWLSVEVPQQLATQPALYLSIGVQTNSFLAPYLAQGSGMVNFSGGHALGPEGVVGERIKALIRRHAPNVRMLATGARVFPDSEQRGPSLSIINGALQRFALRVDPDDCATIHVLGLPPDFEFSIGKPKIPQTSSNNSTEFVSCRVIPDTSDQSAFLNAQHTADVILDRLEDTCPQLFKPRRVRTEHPGAMWLRDYLGTDVIAWVAHGEVEFRDLIRGQGEVVRVGHASDWEKGPVRLTCGRRDGQYFARVSAATQAP